MNTTVKVSTEVGRLRKLLIHRPDGVIGRIIPEKAEEWLYDDIVYRDQMRWEYYHYVMLLLFFLDREKIDNDLAKEISVVRDFLETPFHILTEDKAKRDRMYNFFNPNPEVGVAKDAYHNSQSVLDVMVLLRDLLDEAEYPGMRNTIVTAVCTLEGISDKKRVELLSKDESELVKTLMAGDEIIKNRADGQHRHRVLFAPVPNLIFTRDIGVVANEYILISNAAKRARQRESLFMKYIFKYHKAFRGDAAVNEKVIELADDELSLDRDLFYVQEAENATDPTDDLPQIAVEGGDVMMLNGKYLLIGMSERTNAYAVKKIAQQVFNGENYTGIQKVIGAKIPKNRSSMHLDTIMTQVNTYDWVIYKPFIGDKKTDIVIYTKENYQEERVAPVQMTITEVIAQEIYGADGDKLRFIPSGAGEFPHDRREQWTDGCNLLAVMPGICIGYDRNTKTAEAFKAHGYEVFQARTFIQYVIDNQLTADDFVDRKVLLLLPSGELSRARGGSHCMSMPLLRD